MARSAAVSTATVSRVLTGADRVRSDLAGRVRDAIQALGYIPNAAARALSSLRSGLIGIEVSRLGEHATLVAAAIARLERAGFATLVREAAFPEADDASLAPFPGLDLEGRLFVGTRPRAEVGLPAPARRTPWVVCGADGDAEGASVSVALRDTAQTVAGYLDGLGHRRIGLVSSVASSQMGRDFLSEIRSARPPLQVSTFEPHAAAAVIQAGLGRDRPTAFVCADDAAAAALVQMAAAGGISIPRDVSVIGWGDGPQACLGTPQLTTVRVPSLALAVAAVDLLLDLRARSTGPRRLTVPAKLVLRQSAGPAPC